MLNRFMSATVCLLTAIFILASLTSAFALSTTGVFTAPRIRAGVGNSTSTNWSGYAITGPTGSVTYTNGSWIVPTVTASATNAYSSFWVGIDGYNSGTVEQIGTDSDWVNGAAQYYAWYEFYPKPSHIINSITVSPGDTIYAEVQYSSRSFTVSITDTTTGQSFSTSARISHAQRSSAEWIAEAPSSGGVLPLADFGTVDFGLQDTGINTCYATINGITGSIGSYPNSAVQQITMVDSSGNIIAESTSLQMSGTSFSVDRITSSGGSSGTMSVQVNTDKTSYSSPSWVYISVTATDSGSGAFIQGATVSLTITTPNGGTASGTATTGSSGSATFRYRLAGKAATGTYYVNAAVTASGYTSASDSTTFLVN